MSVLPLRTRKKTKRQPITCFLFDLCKELGVWDVDAVADVMPYRLLLEWQAHNRLRHWVGSEEQEYWRAALIASTIINMTYRGKAAKTWHVDELIPRIFGSRVNSAQVARTRADFMRRLRWRSLAGEWCADGVG